jgi:hypothetical protein
LRQGDVALIESTPAGTLKQVTLILWVAARPETVREVVTHPGEYKHFIPNVSESSWEPRADGGVSTWKLDLPVSSFDQTNIYHFDPDGTISVRCPTDEEDATYRYEILPAQGGTVLVQYGYTDVKHSNAFVRSFLRKMPVTEHGLALAAQMLIVANLRHEAEKRTKPGTLEPPSTTPSRGFGFLLDRGQVAVMRSLPSGALSDVSVLDRVYAPAERVLDALERPGEWSRYIPGVDASEEHGRGAAGTTVHLDFAIPLVTWSTTWGLRWAQRTVEGMGLEGDLRGAHFQWDVTRRSPTESLVVYRVNQKLQQSSTVFRKLIQFEPALEHGLNVAFSLVYLRAIRGLAEGWLHPK